MPELRERTERNGRVSIYRHAFAVRVTHWINVICVLVLIFSGLQILKAHPALYWGSVSAPDTVWIQFPRGLPGWPTLPTERDLAAGRNWHFFFAWLFAINGLIYLASSLWRRHIQRDLTPTQAEWATFGKTALEHAKFHFPRERAYNVIQKLTYLIVVLVLLPLMLLTGLSMSPGWNAAMPALVDFFGGRQSARSLHFISAFAIVLFILVHIGLVLVSGFWNNMRSMITGWYELGPRAPAEKAP